MNKKLNIVRVSKQVTFIKAAFLNDVLHIAEVRTHKLSDTRANQKLISLLHENSRKGYSVYVDEGRKFFSKGFVLNTLVQNGFDNRPKLVSALDAYYLLDNSKKIRFGNGVKKIKMSDSLVEQEVMLNGETRYLIDWDSLGESVGALLLTCHCAVYNQNSDVNHLQAVFAQLREIRAKGIRSARGFGT